MKNLKDYIVEQESTISESITAKSWDKITDKSKVDVDVLTNAIGGSSLMDDRAYVVADNESYEKISSRQDKWQHHSSNERVLSATINSKEMNEIIQKSKEFKLMLPVV